jgi:hypothetical protein
MVIRPQHPLQWPMSRRNPARHEARAVFAAAAATHTSPFARGFGAGQAVRTPLTAFSTRLSRRRSCARRPRRGALLLQVRPHPIARGRKPQHFPAVPNDVVWPGAVRPDAGMRRFGWDRCSPYHRKLESFRPGCLRRVLFLLLPQSEVLHRPEGRRVTHCSAWPSTARQYTPRLLPNPGRDRRDGRSRLAINPASSWNPFPAAQPAPPALPLHPTSG